jgi:hypothetical protein
MMHAMGHQESHDEPDEGVEPLPDEDAEAGVEQLDPDEDDDVMLEELEDEDGFEDAP